MFDDANILVTGGTGSFGQRFIATVLDRHNPRRLIVYSRDEFKQFQMARRLSDPRLRYFIGDVRDRDRLMMAMRNVNIVVHAAALKHVAIAEYNPFEAVRTNIWGAENVVTAAIRTGVRRVIALSTDKAANPINLYGATKLASDKIFIAGNNLAGAQDTRFAVVRYGNVVGSRGSVVPFFKKLVAQGADHFPITDPRMTRFWITLQQGVDFVLRCLETMQGGELYVPKIPSMTVTDLATALDPDKKQRVVGIRPGEKLHEVMITDDDARATVDMGDYFVIEPQGATFGATTAYSALGKPVPADFRYASDNNAEWLDAAALQEMVADIPADED